MKIQSITIYLNISNQSKREVKEEMVDEKSTLIALAEETVNVMEVDLKNLRTLEEDLPGKIEDLEIDIWYWREQIRKSKEEVIL